MVSSARARSRAGSSARCQRPARSLGPGQPQSVGADRVAVPLGAAQRGRRDDPHHPADAVVEHRAAAETLLDPQRRAGVELEPAAADRAPDRRLDPPAVRPSRRVAEDPHGPAGAWRVDGQPRRGRPLRRALAGRAPGRRCRRPPRPHVAAAATARRSPLSRGRARQREVQRHRSVRRSLLAWGPVRAPRSPRARRSRRAARSPARRRPPGDPVRRGRGSWRDEPRRGAGGSHHAPSPAFSRGSRFQVSVTVKWTSAVPLGDDGPGLRAQHDAELDRDLVRGHRPQPGSPPR